MIYKLLIFFEYFFKKKIIGSDFMNSISEEVKEDLLVRLNRIEGQVRGVKKMVENEKYCVDILTQIVAVRGALKKVGLKVLQEHINGCVQSSLQNEDEELIDELLNVINRFMD